MEPIYLSICQKETGKRIRELLKQNGYSVRDIQEAMGFENPQAVYKWTSGKSLPSIDNLLILSRLLHTNIENILVIDGDDAVFWSVFCRHASYRCCLPDFRCRAAAAPIPVRSSRPSVDSGFRYLLLRYRAAGRSKTGSEIFGGACDGAGEQACRTAEAKDQNGIPFPYAEDGKGDQKQDGAARPESGKQSGRTVGHFGKCGGEQDGKSGGSDQCHYGRAQSGQDAADGGSAPVFPVDNSQNGDKYTGRQDTSRRGDDSAGKSGHADSDEGGGIDGYRPGRHLGDSDQIGKFAHGQPAALFDDLVLNDGDGGISAADAEQAYLQKAPE